MPIVSIHGLASCTKGWRFTPTQAQQSKPRKAINGASLSACVWSLGQHEHTIEVTRHTAYYDDLVRTQ